MRTIIFVIVSLLVPLAMWISGCRQETSRARMPSDPETSRLARAPGTSVADAMTVPPAIPALIDPEIMAAPDQPTFARIRAVMDREAAITGAQADPGLFVLPRQEYPEMAIVPGNVPPVSPEFWSRPVQGQAPVGAVNVPGVAAMAPAAPPPASASAAPRFDAYPSYSMPSDPPARVTPFLAFPDPPAIEVGAAPARQPIAENPATIPGMYFGPGDIALSALAPTKPEARAPDAVVPDFFDNVELGMLAPVKALDDLSGLYVPEKPKSAAPAAAFAAEPPPASPPPPVTAPTVQAITPTRPASHEGPALLDISALVQRWNAENDPNRGMEAPQAPIMANTGFQARTAMPPPPASPVPAPMPTPSVSAIAEPFGEVSPPAPLRLEPLPELSEPPAPDVKAEAAAPTGAWDAFKPPLRLDRQSPGLDPLVDYDFSAMTRKEEKSAAQKVKLIPSETRAGTVKSQIPAWEPEVLPLADF